MIHTTALVDPGAKIGANVEIGPYSIIGPHVEIGDNTVIGPHCVIRGHTRIGRDNRIFQFCSLASEGSVSVSSLKLTCSSVSCSSILLARTL